MSLPITRNTQGYIIYTNELLAALGEKLEGLNHAQSTAVLRKVLGISKRQSRRLYSQYFYSAKPQVQDELTPSPTPKVIAEFDGENGVAESVSEDIKTLEDLLRVSEVDLKVWEVDHYVVNKWAVARKNKTPNITWVDGKATGNVKDDGKMTVQPLWQVKAWLKRKIPLSVEIMFKNLLEDAKQYAPSYELIDYDFDPTGNGILLEISPFDLHLGKLSWDEEVGVNYDHKIAKDLFKKAIVDLAERAQSAYDIREILFPIGQDFLHIDNLESSTTAGTRQDADSRQTRIFREGRQLLVDAVEYLQTIAPVKVVCVPGNHDTLSMFHLADALECWFHNNPNVTIDNAPTLRKYHRFGDCLIGFTHGKEENMKELPLIMATERAEDWGQTKIREVHLGHFHHKTEFLSRGGDEFRAIRVCVLPSLSANDFWHESKGYLGKRAAEAHLWDAKNGKVAVLSYNV